MKPKHYALYDGTDKFVLSFRSKTTAVEALKEYGVGSTLRVFYFLTPQQTELLWGHEAVSIESVFTRSHNERASR